MPDVRLLQPISPQDAEQQLQRMEQAMLTTHGPTGMGTMGLDICWRRGAKRDGNLLRRGKQYGHIEYTRFDLRGILTREQALDWLCLPLTERQRLWDLGHVEVCVMCGAAAVGRRRQEHWQRLSWYKPTNQVRVWKDDLPDGKTRIERIYETIRVSLCPSCVGAIVQGKVKHGD